MGIAFITAKAEAYKHRREAKYEEQIASKNLFSGLPDAVERTYRCKGTSDELPSMGKMVLLYFTGGQIKVLDLNEEVGRVMSPDASELKELLRKANTQILPAKVVEARQLSKVFLVQLNASAS